MGVKSVGEPSPTELWLALQPLMPTIVGTPTALALILGVAAQANDPTKSALVMVNLTSAAALSLAVGQTNTAEVVIGPTAAVAAGVGTVIGRYRNSLTGALIVGLAVSTDSGSLLTFALPAGWFLAVRQTGGVIAIASAFDQTLSSK